MTSRFALLEFERTVAAPVATLWQAWTAPAARAVWSPPAPGVTVEVLEADSRIGGREISLCKVAGMPDVRVEAGWLELQTDRLSVNCEVVSSEGVIDSAALITAELTEEGTG
ncbi:MAG: ATPase, partial [Rhodobacterales bacterium 12-65-15]